MHFLHFLRFMTPLLFQCLELIMQYAHVGHDQMSDEIELTKEQQNHLGYNSNHNIIPFISLVYTAP